MSEKQIKKINSILKLGYTLQKITQDFGTLEFDFIKTFKEPARNCFGDVTGHRETEHSISIYCYSDGDFEQVKNY
jgi:hypothetical protein